VGTRLQSIVSDGDVVARVGGDEFIVLLGSTSRKYEISNLAESIIETVSKPIKIGENSCSVGCSIGIGVSGPNSIQPKKLMLDADLALYESKGSGKGQYHFATPELTGKFRTLEEMRQRLSRALEERMFEPVFQPQIDPRQNCVVGVEALARWVGADGEFLPTGEFIELASELDLLDEVDRIIIEKSIRQLANWREDGLAVPRVGLNLCAAKLASCDLLEWLESTIACEGLDNSDVSIEVVESVLLDDNNAVLENIAKLQRRGFGIELDDFGSGHASINTLIDLSVDRIKIDRSLIQDIENKARPRIVVNSIAELAKQLGVSVLIEGVETDLQLEVINSLGEFVYQGYLFARPMKADMFELWFQSFSNDDESNSQNKPSRPCVTFSGMDNLSLSSEATGKEQ
jgi:EAL domain-containing protein (putative c-di-GMP-specific phosphodiesterase class I)